MASICAVGNPLLSPQDASSLSFLSLSHSVRPIMCSLHGPIYQAFSFLFVLAVLLLLQLLLPLSYSIRISFEFSAETFSQLICVLRHRQIDSYNLFG